jgi:DME family drug/metabolite transporter
MALGERPPARVGTALGLGMAGTALLVAGPRAAADLSPRFLGGIALAALAALAFATFVVTAKTSLTRSAPLPLAGATFATAAVLLAPAVVASDLPPVRQIASGWPWYLYLGVVTTGVAYALYTNGLRRVSAAAAGVVSLLEPLSATLLGVLLFGERLGAGGVAGAALLLGAMALLLRAPPALSGGRPGSPRG